MKKILIFIMLIFGMAFTITVKADIPNENYTESPVRIPDIMSATVYLIMETPTEEEFRIHEQKIKEIYQKYHYYAFPGFEPPKTEGEKTVYNEGRLLANKAPNVMNINENPGSRMEIDKDLYEMLYQAEEIRVKTNGYFDYSIGKLINKWKEYIRKYAFEEIPEAEFDKLINEVKKIDVIEDPMLLEEENGRYYVTIKDGVLIDLGAFAKGYATEKATQYLKDNRIETYVINAGTSSITVGQKFKGESPIVHLSMPYQNPKVEEYAHLKIKNKNITTSGSYDSFNRARSFKYKGKEYHHIISPKSKMPEQNYRTLTIVGDDAGLMDALSTALYSMNVEDAINTLNELKINGVFFTNKEGKDKIVHNFDTPYSNSYQFELDKDFLSMETSKGQIGRYLVLSIYIVLVIVVLVVLIFIFKKYGNKIKDNPKVKIIRDGALFIFLFILIGGAALNYHIWPKKKPENAVVLYRKEPYVQINFDRKKVSEIKRQIDDYPIINEIDYNHYEIIMLGDFVENGERQEVVIEVDFLENKVRVVKESSPYNYCSRQGWEKYGSIICSPNSVEIAFREIKGFDGGVE